MQIIIQIKYQGGNFFIMHTKKGALLKTNAPFLVLFLDRII